MKKKNNMSYITQKHKEIMKIKKEHPILDVGCGTNPMGDVNIDIDDYGHNIAINLQKEKLNYPDNYFGTIIISDVLEHTKKPQKILHECKRLLKNNGKIIITIPNSGNLFYLLGIWKQDVITGNKHVNFWTKSTFIDFLKKCNLNVIQTTNTYYNRGRIYSKLDPFCLLFIVKTNQ